MKTVEQYILENKAGSPYPIKYRRAIFEVYRRMYAACGVDYDKEIFETGLALDLKSSFFLDYSISSNLAETIINDVCKEFNISGRRKHTLATIVYMGHTPRFTEDDL